MRSFDVHQKQQHRAVANARERNRTESVNYAFNLLRTLLPTNPPNRKLSKIEILRLSISYIDHLDNVRTALANNESIDKVCTRVGRNCQEDFKCSTTTCTFCITAIKVNCLQIDEGNSNKTVKTKLNQGNVTNSLNCNECYFPDYRDDTHWQNVDYLSI